MTIRHRLLAVGTAALAATLLLFAPSAAAAPNPEAAQAAAGFLVSKLVDTNHLTSEFGDESITADGVLALLAAGRSEDAATITAMTDWLEQSAPSYAATAPEAAAKLAVVAEATGRDATSFGGVDLVAAVTAGVQPDGSFGGYPGPFASGFGILALAGADAEVPQPMVDWLIASAADGGGWGYDATQPADADSTGMAIVALAAVPQPSAEVTAAITAGTDWATANRTANGSWPGYAPVNSTAILGSALQAAGIDQPEAVAYLVSQQQADGGLATGAEGATGSDLLATAQGALLLAGGSYLDATPTVAAAVSPVGAVVGWSVLAALAIAAAVVIGREYSRR